jgi:hypothetical protein
LGAQFCVELAAGSFRCADGCLSPGVGRMSKYQSLIIAKAAGYRPITPTGKAVVHWACLGSGFRVKVLVTI